MEDVSPRKSVSPELLCPNISASSRGNGERAQSRGEGDADDDVVEPEVKRERVRI